MQPRKEHFFLGGKQDFDYPTTRLPTLEAFVCPFVDDDDDKTTPYGLAKTTFLMPKDGNYLVSRSSQKRRNLFLSCPASQASLVPYQAYVHVWFQGTLQS